MIRVPIYRIVFGRFAVRDEGAYLSLLRISKTRGDKRRRLGKIHRTDEPGQLITRFQPRSGERSVA